MGKRNFSCASIRPAPKKSSNIEQPIQNRIFIRNLFLLTTYFFANSANACFR